MIEGYLDITFLIIISLTMLLATFRGFFKTVTSLISLIFMVVIAMYLYPSLTQILVVYINNSLALNLAASVAAFVSGLLTSYALSLVVNSLTAPVRGGFFDKLLGVAVGAIKGFAYCLIIFSALGLFMTDGFLQIQTVKDLDKQIKATQYPNWYKESQSFLLITTLAQHLPAGYNYESLVEKYGNIELYRLQDNKMRNNIDDFEHKTKKSLLELQKLADEELYEE